MSDSISRMRRKFAESIGPDGTGSVWVSKRDVLRYQVKCVCRWQSRSDGGDKGQGSSRDFALDEWVKHLAKQHPVAALACPEFASRLPGAIERHEAREAEFRALLENVGL